MNTAKILLTLILFSTCLHAQVGIGTQTPHNSSVLDVTATDKGILIPKVRLIQTNSTSPILNTPKESLLVYNTATVNDVTPGFYFWNGTLWVRLLSTAVLGEKSLPWLNVATDLPDATNNSSIYHKGNVSVGTTVSLGKLTAIAESVDSEQETYFSKYSNNANEATTIQFLRGRGTSYENATKVEDNDIIGALNYRGVGDVVSGTPQFITLGNIQSVAEGTITASSTPGKLQFYIERYTSDAENPELKMELHQDGKISFNKNNRWATDNLQTQIVAIDANGYLKTINASSLRMASPNKLTHIGNGFFNFTNANGNQELVSIERETEKQANNTKLIADKIVINSEDNLTNEFVTAHITAKAEDLSPLMIENCPVYNSNNEAKNAGLETGMLYRTDIGKLMIVD